MAEDIVHDELRPCLDEVRALIAPHASEALLVVPVLYVKQGTGVQSHSA